MLGTFQTASTYLPQLHKDTYEKWYMYDIDVDAFYH